jgi:uncharacterized protein with PIN domain
MTNPRSRAYWTMRVALLTVFVAAGAVPREVLDMARRNLERLDMTCPVCSTELEHRQGEDVVEMAQSGNFPDYSVTSWHAYKCRKCGRDTGPRGAKFIARQEAREWRGE